jgi:uridine kinase
VTGSGEGAAAVAARVRARAPRCGDTRVVALDGRSGAGKTALAHALATALGEGSGPAPVVPMDDLYPGWDGLAEAVPLLVAQVLAPLAAGNPAVYRPFDWHRGTRGEAVTLPPPAVLVVEGCGCGSRAAAPYLSLLCWLEADVATRRARGLARDGETFAPYWDRWAAQEDALFGAEHTRDRADVVLDTTRG